MDQKIDTFGKVDIRVLTFFGVKKSTLKLFRCLKLSFYKLLFFNCLELLGRTIFLNCFGANKAFLELVDRYEKLDTFPCFVHFVGQKTVFLDFFKGCLELFRKCLGLVGNFPAHILYLLLPINDSLLWVPAEALQNYDYASPDSLFFKNLSPLRHRVLFPKGEVPSNLSEESHWFECLCVPCFIPQRRVPFRDDPSGPIGWVAIFTLYYWD